MLPLLEALASNGLNLIASAVMAKGKDVVEKQLGVKLTEDISPEHALALKQAEFEHEEALRNISLEERKLDVASETAANEAITRRWEADLHSDSWLSKNIRPMTLIYLTLFITLVSLWSHWLQVDSSFVELLKAAYLMVLSAYFIGRTYEKTVNVKEASK